MEADEVNVVAAAVLGDLEQVEYAEEAGLASEFGRDVRQADGFDGIHLNVALVHRVASADADVRAHPHADAAGDFAAPHAVAKPLGEHHRCRGSKLEVGD